MPGLHRDNHKHGGSKQRVLLDGARYEPGPAAKPRAYQQPTLSPAPFVPRSAPEAKATADLPLWPGWNDDPTGRHESRYFDGLSWTDNVQDGARASKDPFEPEAGTDGQFDGTRLVAFQVGATEPGPLPTAETNGNGQRKVRQRQRSRASRGARHRRRRGPIDRDDPARVLNPQARRL